MQCGVRDIFLEHGGGDFGIFKSPFFAPTTTREPLSTSHDVFIFFFLSERSARRMPPAERGALNVLRNTLLE